MQRNRIKDCRQGTDSYFGPMVEGAILIAAPGVVCLERSSNVVWGLQLVCLCYFSSMGIVRCLPYLRKRRFPYGFIGS